MKLEIRKEEETAKQIFCFADVGGGAEVNRKKEKHKEFPATLHYQPLSTTEHNVYATKRCG